MRRHRGDLPILAHLRCAGGMRSAYPSALSPRLEMAVPLQRAGAAPYRQ